MGVQTTDQGIIEIKFQSYLFQIRVISEREVDFQVIDTKSYQKFSLSSHSFATQINSSTLIAALQRKQDQQIKLSVSQGQNSEKVQFLKIVLKVTYDFIPHFEEVIVIPLDNNVDEMDLLKTQMQLMNSDMRDLQSELGTHQVQTGNKIVTTVKSGQFNGVSHNICKLDLTKGKYEINLSFYSANSLNVIFIKLINSQTGADCLKLPEQGFFFTNNNQSTYQPHILRAFVDIKDETANLQLNTINSNSYYWSMKNLILSATSV